MSSSSEISRRRATAKADGGRRYTARREQLLKAAAEVFREKGLAATSVDDIAQAAGVHRASFYYYAGSKEELFEQVVVDRFVANVEMVERVRDSEKSPEDKLIDFVQLLMTSYGESYPALYVFLQEDASKWEAVAQRGDDGVDLKELYRRFDRAVIDIIEDGVRHGVFRDDVPTRVVAYGILGMVNWTHRWFNPEGSIGAEEVGRGFAKIALKGIAAAGP